MLFESTERKTVFILGAGATRGAVNHVRINGRLIRPPLNGDFFQEVKKFVNAQPDGSALRKAYARLQKVIKTEFPLKTRREVRYMEEVFSLLFVTRDFSEIFSSGPGRKRGDGIRPEIDDFLNIVFKLLNSIETSVNEDEGTLYDRLVSKLTANDTLITLNYDTLLDSALWRKGWDPKVGYDLKGGTIKIKWDLPTTNQSENLRNVKLLKLHGSLNWYLRGSTATLTKIFSNKPKVVTRPRSNGVRGHIRQIVPPIYGKSFDHGHWQHLWLSAYRALCEADAIVVVGCSLADTDFHLTGLLGRAIAARKDCLKRAVIVDCSEKIVKKWFRIFKSKSAQKRESHLGFGEFAHKYL